MPASIDSSKDRINVGLSEGITTEIIQDTRLIAFITKVLILLTCGQTKVKTLKQYRKQFNYEQANTLIQQQSNMLHHPKTPQVPL